MADTVQSSNQPREVPLQDRFFKYFQCEITALQEQMSRLADTALIAGERKDATDHCLAGITRLSNEVKDASSYLPTYDQRTYGEAIKALQEKLEEIRATFTPKPKFSFKTKNASAVSINDAAEMAAQRQRGIPNFTPNSFSPSSSFVTTPAYLSTPPNERSTDSSLTVPPAPAPTARAPSQLNDELRQPSESHTSTSLSNRSNEHITLPPTQSQTLPPISIQNITSCLLDLSTPQPPASLTLTSTQSSLLLLGSIPGPAHLTNITRSVLVLSCRQFRMHECHDVDVYLHCTSRPIIEDCSGIRFAELPDVYVQHLQSTTPLAHDLLNSPNQWNQIDDFKWLKNEQSPNWSVLPLAERVTDEVWGRILSQDREGYGDGLSDGGGGGDGDFKVHLNVRDALAAVGIKQG